MCECWATIILQQAELRIGVDLISGTIQITGAIVTGEVIAVRYDSAETITDDAVSSGADLEDRVFDIRAAIPNLHGVIAHRTINNTCSACWGAEISVNAAP